MSPADSRSIFSTSTSTHVTSTPNSAKQAPVTKPTYPVPITATCILSDPWKELGDKRLVKRKTLRVKRDSLSRDPQDYFYYRALEISVTVFFLRNVQSLFAS